MIWKRLEYLLPLLVLFLHGVYYNSIGEIAAARGVDFGPALLLPIDHWIPFLPVFVLPYMALWFLPVYMLIRLARHPDFTEVHMRRVTCGFLGLILACYALWIVFPVSVSLRVEEALLPRYGWLGDLVLYTYQNASAWNACPSFHVAAPWLICRILKLYTGKLPWPVGALTAAIIIATLAIRIHYALDIAGGLLIAEAVHRGILVRLERGNALGRIPSRCMVQIYATFILTAFVIHRVLLAGLAG